MQDPRWLGLPSALHLGLSDARLVSKDDGLGNLTSGSLLIGNQYRSGCLFVVALPVALGSADEPWSHQPLIIPAPTVTPVASSMRMKDPVVRFFEYASHSSGSVVRS